MSLTIEELLNRELIRDLVADYAVAEELGQGVGPVVNVFHPDGKLELSDGSIFHGHAEIEALFTASARSEPKEAGPLRTLATAPTPVALTFRARPKPPQSATR